MNDAEPIDDFPDSDLTIEANWQLRAESITLRIRWFGLIVGYLLVNFLSPTPTQPYLNGILTVGAVYALFDLAWHYRGEVFFSRFPLVVSFMEAVFIGLLCHYDEGINSPFRLYYFLSLLVCSLRYSPSVTYSTFALHAVSYSTLAFEPAALTREDYVSLVLMLIFMGWVTWAGTALSNLLRQTGRKLTLLNQELEGRIQRRTEELQESQAILVQQEKQAAFGLLAAGIAHEVGNPLTAISSLVQMMNRQELDPESKDRLKLIDEQLRRIQRTLRELIEFSRPGTKMSQRIDIHEVIRNALDIAKYYKRKKGKTIKTEFPENLPRVTAVRDEILQVFLNLILNGLDATEEGGMIEIIVRVQNDSLEIDVADDGCGIPFESQEQLFQPYYTTKSNGTGLGLFVCRNITRSAGGTMSLVQSTPGVGTVFRVTLPIIQ
ncbi:ATP-binding protein [Thalassoglobus sp. JC818]|uniref:sensor histidine kinase n=1 Tax=Thalassoglobus sp. JC818 TaxID=3232136 RepID=UPI003459BCFB